MAKPLISLLLLAVALPLAGCASSVDGLCNKAVECDYIKADAEAECVSDIKAALEDEKLTDEDVSECLSCANENSCGLDTVVDCGSKCTKVGPYIFGAVIK